ncbi:Pls/PosA family non-ribosomal peptide synthetase [Aeromicrobium sp. Root344]|uniref:Pls/PosA family non-ribosomal peptide synthetase n=1 Tax=Aeromicrobium sp. Root344 TaxID=1736521 RepID=UPI001F32E5BF|nr:Pls/PosA family non-ribosomal peptide synthetase [Aeromicrobium sp. Root344]
MSTSDLRPLVSEGASPLLRSSQAPPVRTLVDILRQTALANPDASALDNGSNVLTYEEFCEASDAFASALRERGVSRGDRVGVRVDSGTLDLYVAIMGILVAGAAYVPVDVDDPDSRARTVFDEADVAAVVGNELVITSRRAGVATSIDEEPSPADDAWVIFTSGSTGTPKGVAVSHRSAAAFVDAEAALFLRDAPLGPGDRVMAGLSVAFDASCEEMWLAWRHGACLVPAPRSLVKSGSDLGPWMVANSITVVSTVPTLVALWPPGVLDDVRLLIVGGEACPPEIGERLAAPGRELWNTYGPTEATVVACAAPLEAGVPVRIGLPLAGWDLAVVDANGAPVRPGETGELIIGGVGLARYLDPAKDAEKYAPMPSLGWDRAYRSGDLVAYDGEGLVFVGRADEQIKIGGRRIELGEIDSALLGLPGVAAAAAAIRTTEAGNRILVGYVATEPGFDLTAALTVLRGQMPEALVPRLARLDTMPTRTSGKIDRDSLPWPLPGIEASAEESHFEGTSAWLKTLWLALLGAVVTSPADDFFVLGGGSLSAAQLVGRLREKFPEVTVADVYEQPSVAALAATLDAMSSDRARQNSPVRPVRTATQAAQVLLTIPLRTLSGLRWLTWLAAGNHVAAPMLGWTWLPQVSWAWIALGWLLLIAPPGRMLLAALGARALLRGVSPGAHPRGGGVHLRLWLAEHLADELRAGSLSGAALLTTYARLLGARVGSDVDLHSLPPVTGMIRIGNGASIEPEVDLSGHWIDGDTLHIGTVTIGADARVGVRSLLGPGSQIGARAEIGPGSAVLDTVPEGEYWSGAPARLKGPARGPFTSTRAPRRRRWTVAYAMVAGAVALLPVLAVIAGALTVAPFVRSADSLGEAFGRLVLAAPLGVLTGFVALALLVLAAVRLQSIGLTSGTYPVHSFRGWQAWSVVRLMDEARTWLFPLYSSTVTPTWLRLLGARIGQGVEASTVLMLPSLTSVNDGAFLADDTMLGMYELGGGWLRIEQVKIGRRAFVGNSGMTAPGRKVPKGGLVAVLSAAPRRSEAKAGTSWLGSPPQKLRRSSGTPDASRTHAPPRRVRTWRALVELARVVPLIVNGLLGLVVVVGLERLAAESWLLAGGASGVVLIAAGAVAACVAAGAKWSLVGKVRSAEHPLWSSFVWRNELADTFVEVLGAPWLARSASGTPVLNLWLRSLGARVGRGVWCETYWLPEADLITLGAGCTVNRGCVVQTHLFHDRILSMDTVTLEPGSTLGPHSVILPAATIGAHASIGPVSLVMRGESVPKKTRWIGNPIGPWADADADVAAPR